ncbi:hypothetical protein HanRHA438_Chr15g0715931 [Helianthus annuus]|uniref:Protein POLYCHOME n=2 Tax=Helianthus annuus TaxID=4232 RepID=A0A9K3H2U3_HELAN|nr:protein POLYCHOME [Helianthus annuus]KAF5765417.1 hypothetical protein HanXRQr2_Chr15g0703551 [Helianthus annuus]KAJ0451957.1 hypothetical protein HanHA300_Chr15g0573481 [Helianthus annuus]KAJ0456682.1 hypothetical protein HanIR_Chr15g0765231 [Helianthus annuus]KAJ0473839.1 hypothetical protein HanHA89_Chr15g0622931 [Helianthus annuus]KAJ0649415.1 hypothetical protein HanLR1_Chr15g0584021 [Helianthus annuus]
MSEVRDRLTRSNNGVTEMYNPRRTAIGSIRIFPDDETERRINRTPFRWGSTPLTGFETPMLVYRRGNRSQNTPPSGNSSSRGRGGRSGPRGVLPAWYPRTPLGDITHVVRAIERRRERMGDGADQDTSPSDAQLEHDVSFVTPKPKVGSKMFKQSVLGRVSYILTAVANPCEGESELQTPQKKLLNSIDIIEKEVMEELYRLKRTPSAKRAEWEKRVRTLMSMR